MNDQPIYSLHAAEVYQTLETSPCGLPPDDIARRRALYGKNSLAEPPAQHTRPAWLAGLAHPMALILWGAGGLMLFTDEPGWALLIWSLVMANGGFAYWREHRTQQAMSALGDLLPVYARVIRSGAEQAILANDLVPGDILVLAEGDNIPADGRIVEEYGLRTNNATLTGDAVPARKSSDASWMDELSEIERPNLVFAGTSVVSGTGRAVVYATGMLTQFGRIAHLTQQVQDAPSPLQVEMQHVTRQISWVALVVALIVFSVSYWDEHILIALDEAFLLALGIFVALVPEGLPATSTLALAMAGQRLAQRAVLVKKLSTIETLGTVSVICTDKSGTLTQNQMTAREIWVSGRKLTVSGIGYEPTGEFSAAEKEPPIIPTDLTELLTAAALCNNARLNAPSPERPNWSGLGDQTEVALHVLARKGGVDELVQQKLPRAHEIPFDARRKRMSTIHQQGGGQVVYVKGAPREVLALCTHILINQETLPLSEERRAQVLAANDEYAGRALRVLAFARRNLPARTGAYTPERIEQGLTFVGLVGMMDPPRPEVAQAVHICHQAGIRMVMITGDYGLTAESLARRIGLLKTASPHIITGGELDLLSDEALKDLLRSEHEFVFARMAPEHKLRLVAAYQALGEVVAVTGDGVNDAPALRKADVGIAMGVTGTDVAREAADLIITNDNFLAIIHAIEEGRAVYDNLRKVITYSFASNVPEVIPFVLSALFPIPLLITFKQILIIDLGTDLLPGLALGVEKPEPDIMTRQPRRRSQPLIDRPLLIRAFLGLGVPEAILCYTGLLLIYQLPGGINFLNNPILRFIEQIPAAMSAAPLTDELATTIFLAGVVMAQVGNAFACRTERLRGRALGWLSNKLLLSAVTIEVILILLLVYFPPLQNLFGHQALPANYWLILLLYAPALYLLDWIRKVFIRRRSGL